MPRQNQVDWNGERKVGLSSATSPVRKGCEPRRTTVRLCDNNGACGTFTRTQYLMNDLHRDHLGRKTNETFSILQDDGATGKQRGVDQD